MRMETRSSTTGTARGGRGARERILQAAEVLFYTRGIHATGVAALIETAHVSPRTFYVHFPTKNALVEAYLRRFESEKPLAAEAALERVDLTPAQRLLAIFDPLESDTSKPYRGCPFHNAVVDGDFAALEDELQPVLKSLRKNNINIVAIHHHMTHETPRILFLHYWGKGNIEQLASALKSTLALQK